MHFNEEPTLRNLVSTNMKHTKLFLLCMLLVCALSASAESPKREIRSVWLTTAWGIDWPTTRGVNKATQQKAELRAIIDKLHAANFNAVFFQVRSFSDAMYESSYEPWSYILTGTRGKDPGYDPLAYAVEYAHSLGMELHAWVNPYRYSSSSATYSNTLAKDYAKTHPDWIMHDANDEHVTILNPGIPAVREQIAKVIAEIVTKYDVDGVMFDDYFYPNGATLDSEDQSYFENNNPKGLSRADWRRDQVNQMVALVAQTIKDIKPYVRFGISPAGVAGTSQAVANKYGVEKCPVSSDWQYNGIYSDPLAWISSQTIDYISPQIYWKIGAAADYDQLSEWWSKVANKFGRHFYASHTLSSLDEWGDGEFVDQIALNRQYTQNNAPGSVFYSISAGLNSSTFLNHIKANAFTQQALPPAMEWKTATALAAPTNLQLSGSTLSWSHSSAERFTVYAYTKGTDKATALANPSNLVDVVYGTSINLNSVSGYATKTLAVCAYDRYGNEYTPALWNEQTSGTEPNPETPKEGTLTFSKVWTKTVSDISYIETANQNRSMTYYDGKLYIADNADKAFHIVNAADGSFVGTKDLGITSTYQGFNLCMTTDGQLLSGNSKLANTISVFAVDKVNGGSVEQATSINIGRADYFDVYGSWNESGYVIAYSNTGEVAYIPFSQGQLQTNAAKTMDLGLGGSTSARALACDATSFYVNGWYSIPTKHAIATGELLESFGDEQPATNIKTSGMAIFTLAGSTYMLTPANGMGSFDLFDITNGLGSAKRVINTTASLGDNANDSYTMDFATHVSGNDAYIYVLAPNNGVAAYQLTFTPNEPEPDPVLTASTTKVIFTSEEDAMPLPYQDITITASNLTADIVITSTTDKLAYETLSGWTARTGGTLRVSLNTQEIGTHTGTITLKSGAASVDIAVSATVTAKADPGPEQGDVTKPTLTKVWETNKVLDATVRYGTGYNGKVYAVLGGTLYSWDKEGAEATEVTTGMGTHYACVTDEGGNILTNSSFNAWHIYNVQSGMKYDLSITAPVGVTTGYVYNNVAVVGDVLSDAGATMYLAPNGQTVAAKIVVKNGKQDETLSSKAATSTSTFSVEDQVAVMNVDYDALTGESFMWRRRNGDLNCISNGVLTPLIEPAGTNTTSGFATFQLAGVEYGVIPTGATYTDAFSVYKLADGTIIDSRAASAEGNNQHLRFQVEKVSATQVNIYYYKSGLSAGMYTFRIPKGVTTVNGLTAVGDVQILPTMDGVQMQFAGTQTIEVYTINGMQVHRAVATDSYTCTLPQGMYVIRVGETMHKFVK